MNPELPAELAGAVQLIINTILPALSLLVMALLLARGLLPQQGMPSPASSPGASATPSTLREVFGEDSVATARSLVVQPVQELLGAVDKFGGHPTGVRRDEWPACAQCREPLTFVGQLRAGMGRHIVHPIDGLLQIFVCSSRVPGGRAGGCDSADPARGASHVRFMPMADDDVTLGEDSWEREALAGAVRRNTGEARGALLKLGGVEKVGREGRLFYPYLARQYAVISVELLPSVRLPAQPTTQQVALWTAATSALRVQLGGHPTWLRREPADTCPCGAAWEVVLQLDPMDEVLLIPVAARITVQACLRRHGSQAFRLLWQAP